MNILRVPDAKVAISGAEVCKPTSCEGYVTKRSHFRKSWRVRYLVFNGADLQVSYFESRDATHAPGAVPKGRSSLRKKLDQVENDLGHVEGDLDHADKLLRHLKSPVLHVFSNDNRQKKGAPTSATASTSGGASAVASPNSGTERYQHAKTAGGGTLNDLEMLALVLNELEEQANLMNAEAARSTERIARIKERLTSVNDRMQHQTKKATATMKAGNLF
ncbi:hypothetical protein FI667_g5505, partial [Globisporangium splendens]